MRKLFLLAVLLMVPAFVEAQPTFDAYSSSRATGAAVLSWSHTIGSGSNRKLIVFTALFRPTSDTAPTAADCTYNDVLMTHWSARDVNATAGGTTVYGFFYYLDDASLPSAGSYSIKCGFPGPASTEQGHAISVANAASGQPEAGVSGQETTSDTTISDSITTASANAMVLELIAYASRGSATATSGQTERGEQDPNQQFSNASAVGTEVVASAGAETQTWMVPEAAAKVHVLASVAAAGSPAWVDSFTPLNTYWISTTGTGVGTQGDPMSLSAAITAASPGDLFWLNGGTYSIGEQNIANNGTAANPIVWRAIQGDHVIWDGATNLNGDYNWIWGLELTDPNGTPNDEDPNSVVACFGPGIHLINNVIHDSCDRNNIGGWNTGAGQVFYGNVLYDPGICDVLNSNPHNVYTQNTYSTEGLKYYVNNIFGGIAFGGSFNFHAYTEGGDLTGFYLYGNTAIGPGTVLLGGTNEPTDVTTVTNSYFYEAGVGMGYGEPASIVFTNNYMGRTQLQYNHFWGEEEGLYTQQQGIQVTGNTILNGDVGGFTLFLQTDCYDTPPTRHTGVCSLQSTDVWDNNSVGPNWNGSFNVDNQSIHFTTLAQWRTITGDAGNEFDTNSSQVSAPSSEYVVVQPNEYESGRGHIIVFNWGLASSLSVDISPIVANGADYDIYPYKDVWGTAALSGTYSGGSVTLPIASSAEFAAFVVLSQ